MLTSIGTRGMRAVAVLSAAAALAMPAFADIEGNPGFVIYCETDSNYCTYAFEAVPDGNGNWGWGSNEPVPLYGWDGTTVVATLNPAGGPGSSVQYVEDPIVNLNFSVAAGASTTLFQIGSALLTFPTISPAQGRASADFSVTDVDGSGVTLTAVGGNTGTSGYTAAVNGMAGPVPPGANQFTEMIPTFGAGAFSSAVSGDNDPPVGYLPIGAPVSSISSFIRFTLTPFDLASGTSTFEVIPEPASVLLLVLGAGLLRRR
jgi:hypothetical protein